MPAARITLPQRCVSLRKKSPNPAGVDASGSTPTLNMRACTSGDLSVFAIAPLSLATISLGVPSGATMPYQPSISNPGTVAAIAGTPGASFRHAYFATCLSKRVTSFTNNAGSSIIVE